MFTSLLSRFIYTCLNSDINTPQLGNTSEHGSHEAHEGQHERTILMARTSVNVEKVHAKHLQQNSIDVEGAEDARRRFHQALRVS